jgi:hypothetical protein
MFIFILLVDHSVCRPTSAFASGVERTQSITIPYNWDPLKERPQSQMELRPIAPSSYRPAYSELAYTSTVSALPHSPIVVFPSSSSSVKSASSPQRAMTMPRAHTTVFTPASVQLGAIHPDINNNRNGARSHDGEIRRSLTNWAGEELSRQIDVSDQGGNSGSNSFFKTQKSLDSPLQITRNNSQHSLANEKLQNSKKPGFSFSQGRPATSSLDLVTGTTGADTTFRRIRLPNGESIIVQVRS